MNEATLQKALRHFGHNRQVSKCLEEIAELAVELHHHLDGRGNMDAMATELADVLIMAHQMRIMIGKDRVDKAVSHKLDRLDERMRA